ncbi:MAG: hypothetical protein GY801_09735, partial [bacterium]|nr:hypothetical protein [bacterium]
MQTHIQERINKIQKGEVPEGYQKTKVGIIPDNWKLSPIQELLDQKVIKGHLDGNHGALYPRSHEFSTSGIPYVTANDFINGYVNFDRCKFLPIEKANQFKKGVAKTGDVLFAHNATVGPVALLKTDFDLVILSTTATYFRCDNKNLLNKFLVHALQANFFVKQYTAVMSQSTRNQVPITTQRTFKLSLPPFIEQQKIAEILSAWDDAIRLQQELIEQKKTQKRGLMQLLLSCKIRVTEMGKLSPETLKKRVADIQQG